MPVIVSQQRKVKKDEIRRNQNFAKNGEGQNQNFAKNGEAQNLRRKRW